MPSVHSCLEVSHAPLGGLTIACQHGARVLLEGVQQDDQVPGAPVEQPIPGPGEADSQLSQLPVDLGRDWELRRRRVGPASVQVLLDGVVDLRRDKRLCLQQILQEGINWFTAPGVTVEDGLCPPAWLRDTGPRPKLRRIPLTRGHQPEARRRSGAPAAPDAQSLRTL
jgi:hypothetical protein